MSMDKLISVNIGTTRKTRVELPCSTLRKDEKQSASGIPPQDSSLILKPKCSIFQTLVYVDLDIYIDI